MEPAFSARRGERLQAIPTVFCQSKFKRGTRHVLPFAGRATLLYIDDPAVIHIRLPELERAIVEEILHA
jgi:hypothetical protein